MHARASLGVITALLMVVPVAWAGSVTLEWYPNSDSDLAGYKLYYGTSPRSTSPYPNSVTISDKNATSQKLTLSPNTYYFALTAIDTSDNESGFSVEVSATVPTSDLPGKPGTPVLIP